MGMTKKVKVRKMMGLTKRVKMTGKDMRKREKRNQQRTPKMKARKRKMGEREFPN